MKRTVIKNFKQIYTDPSTKEQKEYPYQVCIIRDTKDYSYRIFNLTSYTIWAKPRFEKFSQALDFIQNHPHAIKEEDFVELKLGGKNNV